VATYQRGRRVATTDGVTADPGSGQFLTVE
jgi:hypothetical protein